MSITEWVLSLFLVSGSLFCLLAAIGINRFKDVYTRLHAAGKSSTLGTILLLISAFFYFLLEQDMFVGKILLTLLFIFLTAPMAALMIARSAHRVGIPQHDPKAFDDLKKTYKK
ncbi:monovalent cation/H(+) antiporter subunit G [Alkalicoccobacillus porphyridii]|uniref:Na+/H+ antiporter subunit G n=1 Tax=Alkalicoccobacillus porphyridii TaxID=2597270 RepID=A0A553ZZE7_9BACI|nr:monovalent cation/H(+) antiporter subunit G [Alkalicoccobacillus porphyridii]TSB46805.1 Na+/H+ antiporter subunit G [Alkalicoccobacillus porphyridii]